MNQKNEQSIYHANVDVNLMEEKVIQINAGIKINAVMSVKHIIYVKKIIFGILLHAVAKNGKFSASIIED